MKPSHTPAPPLPATVQKPRLPFIRLAIATAFLLLCLASPLPAAITGTGDLDPTDPTTWTSSTGGYIGKSSTGSITVDSKSILLSGYSYLGYNSGSDGTVTVTGMGSKWANSTDFYVGRDGNGTLNIEEGGQVSNIFGYLGYNSGSTGTATVTGLNSKWTNSSSLTVGNSGIGILKVEAGGLVSCDACLMGNYSGSIGKVTVTGAGAKWINGGLIVGRDGIGTLDVEAGGQVSNSGGLLGMNAGSIGTASISGAGSIWTNSGDLYAGRSGDGALNIVEGGQVSNASGYLGYNSGSIGKITVSGSDSKWTNSDYLDVGRSGVGILNIEKGGFVGSSSCRIGVLPGSSGTIAVTGSGSKLAVNFGLSVGFQGTGILNIGSGIASDGIVMVRNIDLAGSNSGLANLNLNGGTLQTEGIIKGPGTASFNWNDGTIRNNDDKGGLFVDGKNNFELKLAATGTHTFFIGAGRGGWVYAILSDATSDGTLEKQGDGLLTLSAANTYTGSTTIAAGTLALGSAGLLASSPIDVKSGATFDVSAKSGYSIDAGKTLTGAGTIVGDLSVSGIHAPGNSTGVETVKGNYSLLGELQIELAGTTAGTGYDEVLLSGSSSYNAALSGTLSLDWTNFTGSTDATQLWIVKNDTAGTLSGAFSNFTNGASLGLHDGRSWYLYYNADASTGNLTGGNDVLISPVPEPATIVLLAVATLAMFVWRRKM